MLKPTVFHVAVNGKDTDPGSAEAPFATVQRARAAVREAVRGGLKRDVVVLLGGGTYSVPETLTFGPEDGGTEGFSVAYAAAPGDSVTISGGRSITGWKKAETGPLWTAELPESKEGRWCFRQLFVNGHRAVRARTPNADEPSLRMLVPVEMKEEFWRPAEPKDSRLFIASTYSNFRRFTVTTEEQIRIPK